MKNATTETGSAIRRTGRARGSTARLVHIGALGLAIGTSLSALAHAQTASASRDTRPLLNWSRTMPATQITDVRPNETTAHTAPADTSLSQCRLSLIRDQPTAVAAARRP